MLMLLIDSVILIALLKGFNDDDLGWGTAILTSLLFSILIVVLALGFGARAIARHWGIW